MGLSLKKLGQAVVNGLNFTDNVGWTSDSSGSNINRARQSIEAANQNLRDNGARYGVLANQQNRNNFIQDQSNTPSFNPVAAGVRSIWDTNKKVAGSLGGFTGVPAAIDATRLGIAELTNNQDAADAATVRLARNLPQAAPIAAALAVKPFAQDVANTAMTPVTDYYANKEKQRAADLLTPAYENLYKSYGMDPRIGTNAAQTEAEQTANAIRTAPIANSSIDTTTSTGDLAKKVGIDAGSAALAIGLTTTPSLKGADFLTRPIKVNFGKPSMAPVMANETGSLPGATAQKATVTMKPVQQTVEETATNGLKPLSEVKPTVKLKKAQEVAAKIDAKATQENRPTTTAEEVKISEAYSKAGVDPASVEPHTYIPPTPLKETSRLQRAYMTAAGEISRYGQVGKDIATKLNVWRDNTEQYTAQFLDRIPTVMSLNKDQTRQFAQALDSLDKGNPVQVEPTVQKAIDEWTSNIPAIRDQGLKAGLEIGDRGQYYFPRYYKDIHKEGGYQKLIQNIMAQSKAEGKPITQEEAIRKANFMREKTNKRFGHLELSRQYDVPGYEMNHDAIVRYLNGAFERISRAEQFGAKNEVIDNAKAQLMKQGIDPSGNFDKKLNIALGNTDRTTATQRASSGVRQFNAVTSLSAAGISNATQLVNTATVAGVWRTLKGAYKLATDAQSRQAVRESGVALDNSIKAISEGQLGVTNKITRNIASPFFASIEKFNRMATGNVGIDYGNFLAKKAASGDAYAAKRLEQLGVTGDIGATLTKAQEYQAARGLVKASQFKVDPQDLPGWADSAVGKLAMQFRSFGYKQTGFMWNEVLRRAIVDKDFMPLARFITVGAPAGYASSSARNLVRFKGVGQDNQDTSASNSERVLKGINTGVSQVGGYGLPGSTIQSLVSGAKYDNLPGAVVSTVGGPTAGLAAETFANLEKAQKGNTDPLKKEAIRKIPMVGPTAANVLMPSKGKAEPAKAGEKIDNPEKLKATVEAEKKTLQENAMKRPEGSSLQKLSDGRYAYTLPNDPNVHTSDDLKKARKEMAKDAFDKSGENAQIIGQTYFYRDENGDVKSKPKYKYEFDIEDSQNQLDMYIAKENEDYGTWKEVATKQLSALEKLRDKYNKDSQADKVDDTQKKIEQLKHDLKKYESYGGAFTKGRSGRGGGGGSSGGPNISSVEKYAINVSSNGKFGGQKPTVKFGSTPSSKVGGGGSSKPTVSIKKSKV